MSFDTTLRPDPFIGRSFGAYRLTERIADVRVGAAFVAEHRHLDRRAVVKLFQPAPPGTPGGGLPRVEARLRALSRPRHEGVLPLVDVGEGDSGLVFVVLDLQDEEALATLAVRGQAALPWPQVRGLGRQIAGALQWAVGQGIAPADLVPAQIFVAPGTTGRDPRARIDVVTLEGLGLREPPPRAQTDHVLAVGRVLYLLLTGRSPGAVGPDGPPDPAQNGAGRDLPAEAEALVMRALETDPDQRWPDLGALHRALGGRDADIVAATSAGAPGRAWFASAEAATTPAAASEHENAVKDVATVEDRRAAAVFDDRDFDRFGGPGAEFSSDFSPDLQDDADFETEEGSFGAKSLFVRPSRRALISAGVAGGVALALLVVVVGTRVDLPGRERQPPPVAQVPSTSGSEDGGTGGPRAQVDGASASAIHDVAPRTPGAGIVTSPPGDGAAPLAVPPSVAGPEGPTAAPTVLAPAAPGGPLASGDAPAGHATSRLGAGPARPSAGPPSAPAGPIVAVPAAPPASPEAPPSVAAAPAVPISAAPPGAGNDQAPASAGGPLPGQGGPASPETRGVSPGAVPRPAGQDVAEGPQAAAPTSAAAGTGIPNTEAASVPPSGQCAVSLGSKPWADVWIDGRRAGFSPMNDLPLSCGTHEIVFTSRELGVERRISLTLRPGETVRRVVDLDTPAASEAGAAAPPVVGRTPRPECHLSLGSRPWAEVWIDGRRAGVTPLVSLPVRCGKHDVLFFSRETNVERRETIIVPEGQSVKKVVTLVEGE
jgi:hypothetical protein